MPQVLLSRIRHSFHCLSLPFRASVLTLSRGDTMKKSVLMFSLLSGTALMFPKLTIASGLPAHTLTYTPEPKPAFQFEQTDKAYKTAGVCFLGVGDCGGAAGYDSSSSGAGSSNDDFYIDTSNQCLNEGFVRQNCNSVQTIDGVCPYNSAYGLGCKCLPDLISCPAGQVGVGESCDEMYASCECDPALVSCSAKENGTGASCGGRYESCVCKPEYQYTSSNCSYPRSVSGDSCGGQYTDCVCPAGVDEGPYGCAEYYPSPCSSVCKVAYSDNCHIRSEVISSCPNNADCSYFSDCSSKIQSWSCNSGYIQSGNSCINPCDNRTSVISSCPSNASCSYFSDCPSKISSWSCNSGYEKSGNSCVQKTKTCSDYGLYSSPRTPVRNWDCTYVTRNGLGCYDCVKAISSTGCPSGYRQANCSGMSCCCGAGQSCSGGGMRCLCQMNPNL